MSSQQDQVRLIAERIARHLAQSSSSNAISSSPQAGETSDVDNELATLRESLSQLQKRLAQVESQMKEEGGERVGTGGASAQRAESSGSSRRGETQHAPPTHSPWLSGVYVPATHPSDERFGVAEAAVSELVDFFEKEKTCSMEPGNKPCDHCALCSSRGF
ncbi:MAG TPA: hypothetical protein VGO91_05755 [Pyrinomonadaceae bacterium]|jgi:hypothetical protein|nr:hypothetical protein [Pyrinomonadaceae bacterium]